MSVQEDHEEKETLHVDINIPGHDPRTTTPLFTHTRAKLLSRNPTCWICGRTAEVAGPLEAHHYPVERCLTGMVDWKRVQADAEAGELGLTQSQRDAAKAFDFSMIDHDPYGFVDNMLVNGLVLCKEHHIGSDEGIHALPHPLWAIQRYGKEGYRYSEIEIIHHDQ